ncbi:hypothetical protein CDAR_3241 [Caerostris darwini]|uniref:Uncharacterized protein n=1 Tax=Caerostris darwini TaxID=1538125 RepID=A0AAV4T3G9_9ARAC|nr:hypothetical protein CDAR_3241 [Caerostris darwini]
MHIIKENENDETLLPDPGGVPPTYSLPRLCDRRMHSRARIPHVMRGYVHEWGEGSLDRVCGDIELTCNPVLTLTIQEFEV